MIKINTEALTQIKDKINKLKGIEVQVCINRGRKKFDTVNGKVQHIYPSVFTIDAGAKTQTFSYFDVLCGTVVFKEE